MRSILLCAMITCVFSALVDLDAIPNTLHEDRNLSDFEELPSEVDIAQPSIKFPIEEESLDNYVKPQVSPQYNGKVAKENIRPLPATPPPLKNPVVTVIPNDSG